MVLGGCDGNGPKERKPDRASQLLTDVEQRCGESELTGAGARNGNQAQWQENQGDANSQEHHWPQDTGYVGCVICHAREPEQSGSDEQRSDGDRYARVVFVLHDVFDFPFEKVALMVGRKLAQVKRVLEQER
jgi:hypothetical protein